MVNPIDPLDVRARLYKQISNLLTQLENDPEVTTRERIAALAALGRLEVVFVALRKEKVDGPDRGSAVRKYANAFKAHGAGRRKAIAGGATEPDITDIDTILNDSDGDEDSA